MGGQYTRVQLGQAQIETEAHGTMTISTELDCLKKVTIRFGNSFTLRIDEDNLNRFGALLGSAAISLALKELINSEGNSDYGIKSR